VLLWGPLVAVDCISLLLAPLLCLLDWRSLPLLFFPSTVSHSLPCSPAETALLVVKDSALFFFSSRLLFLISPFLSSVFWRSKLLWCCCLEPCGVDTQEEGAMIGWMAASPGGTPARLRRAERVTTANRKLLHFCFRLIRINPRAMEFLVQIGRRGGATSVRGAARSTSTPPRPPSRWTTGELGSTLLWVEMLGDSIQKYR
jgi:hypothetical protein